MDSLIQLLIEYKWPLFGIIALILLKSPIATLLSKASKLSFKGSPEGVNFDLCTPEHPVPANDTQDDLALPSAPIESSDDDQSPADEAEEMTLSDIISQISAEGVETAKKSFETLFGKDKEDHTYVMFKSYFITRLFTEGNYQGAFGDFKAMYDEYTDDTRRKFIVSAWASCYTKAKQHEKAQAILDVAINDIQDSPAITHLTCLLAKSLIESGDTHKARAIINQRLAECDGKTEKASLYDALSEVEYKSGNDEIGALCLQKKAECTPEDSSTLFDAAYKLDQVGVHSISLYNYNTLLSLNPKHQTALNNIGVTASELDLKIKAIEFQSKSYELDESLACANLGFAFLKAGFIDEAKAMAQEGLDIDPPHDNNYALMSQIQKRQDSENEKWDEIIDRSGEHRTQLSRYTDAYYSSAEPSCPFEGDWIDENGDTFTVSIEDGKLKAEWNKSNKQPSTPTLGGILTGMMSPPAIQFTTTYKLSGSFLNKTAKIDIVATETPEMVLKMGPNSYYKLFSYLEEDTGDWIVFSADLKKPYSTNFKRPTD